MQGRAVGAEGGKGWRRGRARLPAPGGYNCLLVTNALRLLLPPPPPLAQYPGANTTTPPNQVVFAAVWLAYGVFKLFPNVPFLEGSLVLLTFLLTLGGPLLGLPVGLLGVFLALYAAGVAQFALQPKLALVIAQALSAAAVLAALLCVAVYSLVFPEYCLDLLWGAHHEGLEHLLHMAHHTVNSRVSDRGRDEGV